MAQRRSLSVAPTPSPTAEAVAGSRPRPPQAGARSDRLDADTASADHHAAKRRLTRNTVAQAAGGRIRRLGLRAGHSCAGAAGSLGAVALCAPGSLRDPFVLCPAAPGATESCGARSAVLLSRR
jgi:hypothetical protein